MAKVNNALELISSAFGKTAEVGKLAFGSNAVAKEIGKTGAPAFEQGMRTFVDNMNSSLEGIGSIGKVIALIIR